MRLSDLSLALKRLRSHPMALLAIITMLAVGGGLATTMFALSDPFLARPLPYANPDRLVLIDIRPRLDAVAADRDVPPDYPLLSEWGDRTDVFSGLAAFHRREALRVSTGSRVVGLRTVEVTPNLFEVLGVRAPLVATPSTFGDEVWLTQQGTVSLATADLGNAIVQLRPTGTVRVAGVLPDAFVMPSAKAQAEALLEMRPGPIATTSGARTDSVTVVGRLRAGVSVANATAALAVDARRRGFGVEVTTPVDELKAPQRRTALAGLLAGVLLLCVCWTNTFGFALTRGLGRVDELATMEVLGASRGRLASLLLVEGLLLGTGAAAGALAIGTWACELMARLVPPNLLLLGTPGLSLRVSCFAAAAGAAGGAAFAGGSLLALRGGMRESLRDASGHGGWLVRGTRSAMTAVQVAATTLLLVSAALFVRSYAKLLGVDSGMSHETLALSVSYDGVAAGSQLIETIDRTVSSLRSLPGVRSAAATVGEMADGFNVIGLVVLGRPQPVEFSWVSADYFSATGMQIVDGRPLTTADAGRPTVVVNDTLATRYLGSRSVAGRLLAVGGTPMVITGVVKDSRRRALDQAPMPGLFRMIDPSIPALRITYVVAADGQPAGAFEARIREVSPDAILLDSSTLHERLARTIRERSFATLLTGLFSATTLLVTMVGIWAVVGYLVARRTREIGVRVALGATPARVVWLVIADSCLAVAVGISGGLVMGRAASAYLQNALYGVVPGDPPTIAAALSLLVASTVAAAFLPARHAARLSPAVAIREG